MKQIVVVWIRRLCFFFSRSYLLLETKFIVYERCMHCSCTVHVLFTYVHARFTQLKILKMGLRLLFTYLKIILLQYFQFSISITISSIHVKETGQCC